MAFSSNRRGKSRTMRTGWLRSGRWNGIFARHGFWIVRCWRGRILKSVRFSFGRRWRMRRPALPVRLARTVAAWLLPETTRSQWLRFVPTAQLQARAGPDGSRRSLGHEPCHGVLAPVVPQAPSAIGHASELWHGKLSEPRSTIVRQLRSEPVSHGSRAAAGVCRFTGVKRRPVVAAPTGRGIPTGLHRRFDPRHHHAILPTNNFTASPRAGRSNLARVLPANGSASEAAGRADFPDAVDATADAVSGQVATAAMAAAQPSEIQRAADKPAT